MNLADWYGQIDKLSFLEDNWDGQGAAKPSHAATDNATLVVAFMYPLLPCKIAPSVEGGVGITYKANDKYAYAEASNDGVVAAMVYGDEVEKNLLDASEMGMKPFTEKLKEVLNG